MQPRVHIWPRKVECDVVSTPGCANIDRGVAVTKNSTEREYNVPSVVEDGAGQEAEVSARSLASGGELAECGKNWALLRRIIVPDLIL